MYLAVSASPIVVGRTPGVRLDAFRRRAAFPGGVDQISGGDYELLQLRILGLGLLQDGMSGSASFQRAKKSW